MKIKPEIDDQIARIDESINQTRSAMDHTDDAINRLLKLNESRRHYLRQLGQKRAELTTFELELG